MIKLKLTKKEVRALVECLDFVAICRNGCAFREMQCSGKSCDECEFPKLVDSILNKAKMEG